MEGGKEKWVFGHTEPNIASVLLATDGIYDMFFPYLLKMAPVEVYVPLIRYFMDQGELKINSENQEDVIKERMDFLSGESCVAITDDKTLVVLLNSEVVPEEKNPHFYDEPDWETLQSAWNEKAYPLWNSKQSTEVKNDMQRN